MKKLLFSFVIVVLVLMGTQVFADNPNLDDTKYLIVNDSGENALTTHIPTSIINPTKHRILRFKVCELMNHSEGFVCLYDATSSGYVTEKVAEGELELNDYNSQAEERYIKPLNLKNGVTIHQGIKTAVLVEWEYKY